MARRTYSTTFSYATFSAVALCLAGFSRSQAPNDREQGCVSDPLHPQYDDHVRPLLDTRDYGKLLPYESSGTGGVWQTLDNDGDGAQWGTVSAVYCNEVVHVCGRSSGPQDNWMITQHISVPVNATKVMIYSRLESPCSPSSPSCVEYLSLYVWETSNQSKTSAADTSNYHFIANITTAESVIELPPLTQSGLYLGIRDNGTCVTVSRVLVYYSVCEAGRQGLVRVEGNSSAGDTLPGTCVENSVSTSGSGPPLLQCLESGQWAVLSGCQCSPHFFLDNSRDLCLKPPAAPRGVRVSDVTNQTLTLSWSPPPSDGSPQYDTHYIVSYSDQRMRVEGGTQLNVTGLIPFFSYTFSVMTENSVSWQDTNTRARTTSVTTKTLEGVAGRVEDIEINEGGGGVFISWSQPEPPHGIILHYYIKIIERGKETLIKDYNSTTILWDTWRNKWKMTTADNVKIQIQAETSVGRGEYSEEVDVFPTTESTENDDASGLSTELLIVAVMVPIVFLLLIIIVLVIIIRRMPSVRPKTSPITPNAPLVPDIEDYASIKLSPNTPTTLAFFTPPPIPRSPRPKKPNQSFDMNFEAENNPSCRGGDPTYHVLEDPSSNTGGSSGNPYSLDPIDTTEMFGEPHIDLEDESQSGAVGGCGQQERVYFTLEDPESSSLIKHRTTNHNPTYESVKGNWNEGLGPDQPKLHVLVAASEGEPGEVGSEGPVSGSGIAATSGATPPTETV